MRTMKVIPWLSGVCVCAIFSASAMISQVEDGRVTQQLAAYDPTRMECLTDSVYVIGDQPAWHAFDRIGDSRSGRWLPSMYAVTNGHAWITYIFDSPAPVLKYYRVMACGSSTFVPFRTFSHFKVEGSNDDSIWVLLDEQTSQRDWSVAECRQYSLPGTARYRYVRFTALDVGDRASSSSLGDCGEIAEIAYYTAPTQTVDRYVSASGNHSGGFTAWETASKSLQDAIDLSFDGDRIFVEDGFTCDTTVARFFNSRTSNLCVNKAIRISSKSGTLVSPVTVNGSGDRCGVYLVEGSSICGFSVTNGRANTNNDLSVGYGGCVYVTNNSNNARITNCRVSGGTATRGAGVSGGTLTGCELVNNTSKKHGAGAIKSILISCSVVSNTAMNFGGGCALCVLTNCFIAFNSASTGGGTFESYQFGCGIVSNTASSYGGGVEWNTTSVDPATQKCRLSGNTAQYGGGAWNVPYLYNCIVNGNHAQYAAGIGTSGTMEAYNCAIESNVCTLASSTHGAAHRCALYNCTVANNTGWGITGGSAVSVCNTISWNNSLGDGSGIVYSNCCSVSAAGAGNITANPMLTINTNGFSVLSLGSPCINKGVKFSWMTDAKDCRSRDLEGKARLNSRAPDLGAVERKLPKGLVVSLL